MFPNVAHSAIMADLTDTQDMEETINNILDGYVASSAAATNASDTDAVSLWTNSLFLGVYVRSVSFSRRGGGGAL